MYTHDVLRQKIVVLWNDFHNTTIDIQRPDALRTTRTKNPFDETNIIDS